MVEIISGQRFFTSFLSVDGAEVITNELDFQLGAREGVEIHVVWGLPGFMDDTSLSTQADNIQYQSIEHELHASTATTLENPPTAIAADAVNIDTEIFFAQVANWVYNHDTAAGEGQAISMTVTPNEPLYYPKPILLARNPTHRAEGIQIDMEGRPTVYGIYNFVRFTNDEIGFLLARR